MVITLQYLLLTLFSANENTSKGPAKSNTSISLNSNIPTIRVDIMFFSQVSLIKWNIAYAKVNFMNPEFWKNAQQKSQTNFTHKKTKLYVNAIFQSI